MKFFLTILMVLAANCCHALAALPAKAEQPPTPPVVPVTGGNRAAFDQWQKTLAAALAGKPAETLVTVADFRGPLAQSELLRACGPEKVWETARRPGGGEFLQAFFSDVNWMESFLMAGPADLAQSLENLRLLYRHCRGWDDPVVKRMGTALVLSGRHLEPLPPG